MGRLTGDPDPNTPRSSAVMNSLTRFTVRLTPQFSGRTLPCEARRERIMKWRARAVAATPYHGPLQLLVMRRPVRGGRSVPTAHGACVAR